MGTQVTRTENPLSNSYILPCKVASPGSKSSDNMPTPHPLNPAACFSSFSVSVTKTKKRKEREESHKIGYFESLIQANARFYGKRYAEVYSVYEKILQQDPYHLTALYRQSIGFWKCGFIDQALTNLKTLLLKYPKDEEAWAAKGAIQIQKNQYNAALNDIKKSALLNPSSDFIQQVLLENCYYAFRQLPENEIPDLLELGVEDRSLLKAIAFASQNNYTSAVQELSTTMSTNPNSLSSKVLTIFKIRIQDLASLSQSHLSPKKSSSFSVSSLLDGGYSQPHGDF
jgi:tetratricopeptide (TPR) repeat protein